LTSLRLCLSSLSLLAGWLADWLAGCLCLCLSFTSPDSVCSLSLSLFDFSAPWVEDICASIDRLLPELNHYGGTLIEDDSTGNTFCWHRSDNNDDLPARNLCGKSDSRKKTLAWPRQALRLGDLNICGRLMIDLTLRCVLFGTCRAPGQDQAAQGG
jgi:hypothetical protein